MSIPVDDLKAAGADVGAGVNEIFLNRFSAAHFKAVPSLYSGKQRFDNFDQPVEVAFAVTTPIVFDLAPLLPARFEKLWLAHLRAKGSPVPLSGTVPTTPPNLVVTTSDMKFVVTVLKKDGSTDFSVDFDWDMTARCGVLLVDLADNRRAIRLDPLKVEFSTPQLTIQKDIRDAIRAKLKIKEEKEADPQLKHDTKWCIDLEKLFLFIINQVLAIQLANFLKTWELPRAIQLIDGVDVSPSFLAIRDHALIAAGHVLTARAGISSELSERLNSVLREFRQHFDAEFQDPDFDAKKWKAGKSESFLWLKAKADEYERDAQKLSQKQKKSKARYDENLCLFTDDKLIDQLARIYLNTYRHDEFDSPEFAGFRASAGWWFRVDNARGRVVPGGVAVDANVSCGGHAGIDCRNFWDPKHWGEWEHFIDLCINIKADPDFSVAASPEFRADGIYLRTRLENPKQLHVKFCGNVPGAIPQALLGWILTLFSGPLLDAIRSLIAMFAFKVASYPRQFPGTALNWTPNMNSVPTNEGPYLTFSADPVFS
ncbi:hypothetical protein [Paraburkholderia sp. 35.1]|uniref:hypothetical protein n=1 Tax=Paraburkholderia sp. 35.1 TaxID=2991058 RepID=UPI003D19053F